jgi:hypothetical protein
VDESLRFHHGYTYSTKAFIGSGSQICTGRIALTAALGRFSL